MTIMSADLLRWSVFSIKHVHLDIESICSFHEHSSQLPTTEYANLWGGQHRKNGYPSEELGTGDRKLKEDAE